ncbi:MAG TPA: CPBP family intramembrane glutamic endopeptidase [Gemmatimonadales bacterium]|jgi:hypothetical protein|nr:CPBP family intramembrane glutamic endopeptidase [Gemmatimonadales bacterium]
MPPAPAGYWNASRAPRHSLLFAFPLLLLYEILAAALSGQQIGDVRNGADVLLKSVFASLGGRYGVLAFSILLFGVGTGLVWRDRKRNGEIRPEVFVGMLLESALYAVLLGGVAGTLTSLLLHGRLPFAAVPSGGMAQFGLPTQLMISLGAGIYEELLFRVLLVSGLALVGRAVLGLKAPAAAVFAALIGAVIFSLFHYIGRYGDVFTVRSFTFRAVAGLLFSGLYLLRGFGITAWSHALYDVLLSLWT